MQGEEQATTMQGEARSKYNIQKQSGKKKKNTLVFIH
jgi:hypothetical protein